MEKKDIADIVLDGVDSTANILSNIHPALAGITIITFAIRQIISFVSPADILKRIKRIEKQLEKKKITIEEFQSKIQGISEHDTYVVRNNLNNILLNCIPETIDIYISIWIDFIMNENNSTQEELCEILNSLNKNDLILMEMISSFIKYGDKRYYITSDLKKKNQMIERIQQQKEIKEYNKKTKGIKKLDLNIYERDMRIGTKTIFWKDFSNHYKVNVEEMGYMILEKGTNEKGERTMNWAHYARSFIKLDRLGIIQLEYLNTIGTLNSMNIDRFHITLFGVELMKYIPLKRKIEY